MPWSYQVQPVVQRRSKWMAFYSISRKLFHSYSTQWSLNYYSIMLSTLGEGPPFTWAKKLNWTNDSTLRFVIFFFFDCFSIFLQNLEVRLKRESISTVLNMFTSKNGWICQQIIVRKVLRSSQIKKNITKLCLFYVCIGRCPFKAAYRLEIIGIAGRESYIDFTNFIPRFRLYFGNLSQQW